MDQGLDRPDGWPDGWLRANLATSASTNSDLLARPDWLARHGLVVTTDAQTGGRGRMGRSFASLPGKSLTFSVALRTTLPMERLGLYSLGAGVAVARALGAEAGLSPVLKWPNDALLRAPGAPAGSAPKKVCGVLTESAAGPDGARRVVVGVGLNAAGRIHEFPEELRAALTTLEECGAAPDRARLLAAALRELDRVDLLLESGRAWEVLEEWRARAAIEGMAVRFETAGGMEPGTVEGVSPSGGLLIRDGAGALVAHVSGDVLPDWSAARVGARG